MDYKDFSNSVAFNPGIYSIRAIIEFLREMFNANQDFGFKVYDDEQQRGDAYGSIIITSKFDWESKYRNKRPAITVSHGNIITGVNGTQGSGKILSISEDGSKTTYSDLISFPIVIECISEVNIECATLSSIVNVFLTSDLRPLRSLGFQLLGSPAQSPSQQFEKNNVSFISSVIINVQLNRKYTATIIDNEILERIKFKLTNFTEMNIK